LSFRELAALGWVTDDTKTVTIRVAGEGKGVIENINMPATAVPGENIIGSYDIRNTGVLRAPFRGRVVAPGYDVWTPLVYLDPNQKATCSVTLIVMPTTDITVTLMAERLV